MTNLHSQDSVCDMPSLLKVIAYLCIWLTPLQLGFCLWALTVTLTTDATLVSLSNEAFLSEYLPALYAFVWPLSFVLFPDAFATLLWSLPTIPHQLFRAIVGTAIGIWLLRKLNPSP